MKQCDRILATGGGAMVTAAYSSGTPALGVGVGNAVITVDDTADLDDAAEKIRISKTLDLAASCSSDNSVLLFDSIYDKLLDKLEAKGGYLVNDLEKAKLQDVHSGTTAISMPPSSRNPQRSIAGHGRHRPARREALPDRPETGFGP